MKRFILVSFGFLAWVFYELSGGADFQPRVAEIPAGTDTEIAEVAPPAVVSPPTPEAPPVSATTLVASPAIAPVETVQEDPEPAPAPVEVAATPEPEVDVESREADSTSEDDLDQIRTSLSQGLSLFSESEPIARPLMLASLEQGAAGLSEAPAPEPEPDPEEVAEVAPPPADIREVTGTRVNMRDGPGTIYPVISRLTIGHEVEVLGDSGTGWLRLRTVPENQIGWIAASLISKDQR